MVSSFVEAHAKRAGYFGDITAAIDREHENTASHGGEDEAIAAAVAAACTTEPAGTGHVITMLTESTEERWAFVLDRPGRPSVITFAPRGAVSFTYEGVEYPLPVLPAERPESLLFALENDRGEFDVAAVRVAYEKMGSFLTSDYSSSTSASDVLNETLPMLDPYAVLEAIHSALTDELSPKPAADEWDGVGDVRFTLPTVAEPSAIDALQELLEAIDDRPCEFMADFPLTAQGSRVIERAKLVIARTNFQKATASVSN